MFLKNYTSDVPVSRTIHRIEQILIRCGVTGITKEYGPHAEVAAVKFHIQVDPKTPEITIRLPADRDAAQQALWMDYVGDERNCLTEDGNALIGWKTKKRKGKAGLQRPSGANGVEACSGLDRSSNVDDPNETSRHAASFPAIRLGW